MIEFKNINYIYDLNTPYEKKALKNINLKINSGEFVVFIGNTGSGKSSLMQLFNGIEKASSGEILFYGENIYNRNYNLHLLKEKIGLVFQYPEDQLFKLEVLEDVCFGPMNYGFTVEESLMKARNALKLVGVSEKYFHMSPFELSGGIKRRVALAGILAMNPSVLVLDEISAGLDSEAKEDILKLLKKINEENGVTIILASHNMEDAAIYAKRIVVLNEGEILYDDEPKKIFENYNKLEEIRLLAPKPTYIIEKLKREGFNTLKTAITIKEASEIIFEILGDSNE